MHFMDPGLQAGQGQIAQLLQKNISYIYHYQYSNNTKNHTKGMHMHKKYW